MLTLRRWFALGTLLLIPLGITACGGGEEGGGEAASEGGSAPAAQAVAVENPGVLVGTVALQGAPPPNEPIDMSDEPTCAQKHTGTPTKETVVANNGRLGNVFVYIKEGLSGDFPAPREAKVVDQVGCRYTPHVIGVQAGQQLTFRNSDGILHNINASPEQNRGFNISQPTNMESSRTFNTQEVMVPLRCDVHGWMEAYVGVVDHPYYAVTSEDGSFRIENLPPGNYVIETWHERFGTQTQQVAIGPNETKELQFQYNANTAVTAVVPMGEPIDPHADHAAHAAHAPGTGRE